MNDILVKEIFEILVREGGMLTPHRISMYADISVEKALDCCKILKKQGKVEFGRRVVHKGFRNCKCKVVLVK
jgi:hypothetical protein